MKKLLLLLLTGLLFSCNDREVEFNDLGYSEQIFGVQFNPDQDWCTTVSSSIYSVWQNPPKNSFIVCFGKMSPFEAEIILTNFYFEFWLEDNILVTDSCNRRERSEMAFLCFYGGIEHFFSELPYKREKKVPA